MPSGRKRQLEYTPEGGRSQLSVQVDWSEKATLIRLARKRGISVTELIRTYIAWGIEADSK